ncbi:MAG: hypothetical protein DI629_10945 [Mesorhizobium amorphae]|nr:MAG: hypothetical protein DI629_10945 [Mesorhizobium amorphae]
MGQIPYHRLTERLLQLLWVLFAVDCLALPASLWERFLLKRYEGGESGEGLDGLLMASDRMQAAVGITQVLLTLVVVVTAAIWIRRANMAARALGAQNLRFTPNWAIGWYFVPLANLFMPFRAMAEIWRASGGAPDWKNEALPSFFAGWWGFWLASNVVGQFAGQSAFGASAIDSLMWSNTLYLVADAIAAMNDLFFIQVVTAVYARQAETATRSA